MRLTLAAIACVFLACGTPARPPHVISGCSPLQQGDTTGSACVTPFPNAWFEETNAATKTGLDVRFPDGALPTNAQGVPLSQSTFGTLDGYSPATPIIAYFPNGVNASQLTTKDDMAMSEMATNPIALVDLGTGQRVPFFAEVDANQPMAARHGLLIHPMVRLKYASRYAVAITTALQDSSGNPLAPQGDFALWVQDKLTNTSPLAQIADRLDADATAFAALGIPKTSLALAWDFDTASDELTTGYLFGMVQEALQKYPTGSTYTIQTPVNVDSNGNTTITGTFQSPSFESGPDPSPLNYGTNNTPVMGDLATFNFTAVIPACVASASAPVPVLIIGHGLFGNAAEELQGDTGMLNQLCMVAVGADFLGLTGADFLSVIAAQVLPNGNNFPLITDRVMQSHVNFQILTRLTLNALASDPSFQIGGKPSYDPTQIYYWGSSNGGIQGATYLALSPDVNRGLLNVPGAEWSLLIWRSGDFGAAGVLLDMAYPDALDQQILMAMSQSLWDRSDPIEFGTHLSANKHALFQQSMGDPEVTNIATELEARTLGLTGLAPLVTPVYGVTASAGPLDGLVYTQWSVDPMPLPGPTNTSPDVGNNDAHTAIRGLPAAIEQMRAWLQPNGKAINTCDGNPCVYPGD